MGSRLDKIPFNRYCTLYNCNRYCGMKNIKSLSFLIGCIYLHSINAQIDNGLSQRISGKLIIAQSGVTIGTSKELTKGTQLDFEYDGKSISASIGGELFSDTSLSTGIGIKLADKPCFFMTVSDGVELGGITVKGSGEGIGSLLEFNENDSFRSELGIEGEICIDWVDNKRMQFSPLNSKYQSVLSLPNVLVDNLLDFSIAFDQNASFAKEFTKKGQLSFENNDELELDTYCLDWELDIPDESVAYNYLDNINPTTYSTSVEPGHYFDYTLYHGLVNQQIWEMELLKDFSEKYISKMMVVKDVQMKYTYGVFYFLDYIEISYFPYNQTISDDLKLNTIEKENFKEFANGDIAIISGSEINSEILEKFSEKQTFNFTYIIQNINN